MKNFRMLFLLSVFLVTPCIFSQNQAGSIAEVKDYKVASTDGVKLFTRVSGKGPVCIFIHGGPGAWSKSFEDFGGINLEDSLTMVYFDQRGCGRSDSAKDYSIAKMADDVESIRKYLKADSVYILSHSFGGIIALNYALKYPAHIKGLIFANVTLNMPYSLKKQIERINFISNSSITVASPDSLLPKFLQARNILKEKGYDYLMLSENKISVEKIDLVDKMNPGNFDFSNKVWGMKEYFADFTPLTKNVKTPVLIIAGSKDYAVGTEHYKSFLFPNVAISYLKGGHLLYIDTPDEFHFSIRAFVNHGLNYKEDE
jgi:proline iminopeptidase